MKGILVDKCRNMLYRSDDKCYVRKRKCPNETSSDEVEEKFVYNTGKLEIQGIYIKNKMII